MKNVQKNSRKKESQENGSLAIAEKGQDRKSKRTRQKNERGQDRGNQMTALGVQTGGKHQTSQARNN